MSVDSRATHFERHPDKRIANADGKAKP